MRKSRMHMRMLRSALHHNGSDRACKIIATEYNLGASNSMESAASPNYYGDDIWTKMSDPVLAHYFPNT